MPNFEMHIHYVQINDKTIIKCNRKFEQLLSAKKARQTGQTLITVFPVEYSDKNL